MIHVEIPFSDIHKFIDIKLKAAGIDLRKEMKKWTRLDFANDDLVLIYEQDSSTTILKEEKVKEEIVKEVCERPSYLKGR